jgi:hypothetical protein
LPSSCIVDCAIFRESCVGDACFHAFDKAMFHQHIGTDPAIAFAISCFLN